MPGSVQARLGNHVAIAIGREIKLGIDWIHIGKEIWIDDGLTGNKGMMRLTRSNWVEAGTELDKNANIKVRQEEGGAIVPPSIV